MWTVKYLKLHKIYRHPVIETKQFDSHYKDHIKFHNICKKSKRKNNNDISLDNKSNLNLESSRVILNL